MTVLLALLASSASVVEPNPWMILPFVVMLLCIALMPFINLHWWEHHYPKVAVALAAVTVSYYLFALHNGTRLVGVAHEYVSFIALIGSLFVVASGIHIQVKGEATPGTNCVFLLLGAILANLIGTTGASMLLIRPWIRMNKYRITAFHVVFFIFIVSNVGGCLTPIGDPPLFLGYLKGVPFWWTLHHLSEEWVVAVLGIIGVFFVFDIVNFRKAPKAIRIKETRSEMWRFDGMTNVFFLAAILGAVFIERPVGIREVIMVGAAAGSYFTTPRAVHEANDFTFAPIKEVAFLFIGIFGTMVPALDYLQKHANSLGIESQRQFYWLTGLLSGVLDNAPTYLTFLAAAFGLEGLSMDNPANVTVFVQEHAHHLIAISLGAVFFGAMTYIGNGPNFMVRSIALHAKVRVPSFFGYVVKYSVPILIPFFFLISMIFL
jgi:Na+/H+ antiporter NhaD/arsenite permease-like protein